MTLLFLAGIYFFARGVFALYGQTIFYTKRVLENIEEKDIPVHMYGEDFFVQKKTVLK